MRYREFAGPAHLPSPPRAPQAPDGRDQGPARHPAHPQHQTIRKETESGPMSDDGSPTRREWLEMVWPATTSGCRLHPGRWRGKNMVGCFLRSSGFPVGLTGASRVTRSSLRPPPRALRPGPSKRGQRWHRNRFSSRGRRRRRKRPLRSVSRPGLPRQRKVRFQDSSPWLQPSGDGLGRWLGRPALAVLGANRCWGVW